jgi:hypothetical protein
MCEAYAWRQHFQKIEKFVPAVGLEPWTSNRLALILSSRFLYKPHALAIAPIRARLGRYLTLV